ncbi:MAG: sugar ABC transporter permease [Chloroflexota bacterium]|nr:sugar ABC transporter permease [Chloroflexota bacterium]
MAQDALSLPAAPARRRMTFQQSGRLMGYLLVAPLLICILVLVVYPFMFAVWISFTDRMIGTEGTFVGLENYVNLVKQPSFSAAVSNTIVMVLAIQLLKLVLGLGIAVLLNQPIRGRQMWRSLILLPWAMPAFVAFITWKLLYAPQAGAFNYILIGLGFVDSHVDFLSSDLALPSVVFASFWRGFPFWVISFLAAMQAISREQYESASLDGASGWGRFWHVTLPGIRHVILVVVLTSTIWTTNSFEAVWLLTGGGPSNATMTFPLLSYYGLQSLRIGEAASASVVLLPIFAVLAVIIAVRLQKED